MVETVKCTCGWGGAARVRLARRARRRPDAFASRATGMSVEALDLATRNGGIAACLIVSNGSNPLGCVMPDSRKREFSRLTAARGVAVIEDDIYGDLHLGGDRPWPIKAFDTTDNNMGNGLG